MAALCLSLFAAGIAGFSRGFAAFGTAIIFVPLVTLAYDSKTALVTLFLVDIIPAMPLIWRAAPQCDKATVSWMAVGAVALTPVGVAVLLIADPAQSQLVLGFILMAAVSYMLLRSRFRIVASPMRSVFAGAISGFAGGVCGIFGPPAMVYLLGRSDDSRQSRYNAIVFLTGESLVLGATYFVYGMYTRWHFELAALLLPIYASAMWYGATRFAKTNEHAYRTFVLGFLWVISAVIVAKSIADVLK